jgi:hypothetical protein
MPAEVPPAERLAVTLPPPPRLVGDKRACAASTELLALLGSTPGWRAADVGAPHAAAEVSVEALTGAMTNLIYRVQART